MFLVLILLILIGVGIAYYATQNSGAHDYHFYNVSYNLQDWVPVAVAAGVVALLWLLYTLYAGARMSAQRAEIRRLREEVMEHREGRRVGEPTVTRDVQDDRGARDQRDLRDDRGVRDERDLRDDRGVRDERDMRGGERDIRDDRGVRDERDMRGGERDMRDERDTRGGERDMRGGERDTRSERAREDVPTRPEDS